MGKAILIVAGFVAFSMLPGAAHASMSTVVEGARATTADWSQGKVDNIRVSYPDWKPYQRLFSYVNGWSVWVSVEPASNPCPDFNQSRNLVWASSVQRSPGSVSSGPRPIYMNGSFGQRLCIYEVHYFSTGELGPNFRSGSWQVGPYSPSSTMTLRKAIARAKVVLAKRYGRLWKKGMRKRVSCVEKTTTFTCRGTWTFKGKKRRGIVSVAKT